MQLNRRQGQGARISLVAMIDVLMILLVFFMVTSTYLDLDMVPLAGQDDVTGAAPPGDTTRLLVLLDSSGSIKVQGAVLSPADLSALVAARLGERPGLEVVVLPSGQADVQALARLMDAAVQGGAGRLRIVRLEGAP